MDEGMPRPSPHVLPPADYLRERFSYDPKTGELRWKPQPREAIADLRCWASWNGKHVGKIAGTLVNGYYSVCLDYRYYRAHRIIWKMMTGEEPPESIDHKDTDRGNHRWSNLRTATQAKQAWNSGVYRHNTSGFRGVSFHSPSGRYQARIKVNGVTRHLGYHATAEAASAVYESAARALHGEWFYEGRR